MSPDEPRRATVLTLCGSLQRRSTNEAALEVARVRLGDRGDVVDDYRTLADVPAFNVDLLDAPGRVVDDWRQRVAAADAVLIAAPEYAGGVAGVVKNALDWLVGSGALYRKPVAVLSAATTGGIEARRTTAQTLSWQGAYIVGELGIVAPRTKVDGENNVRDPATVTAIVALVDRLVWAGDADGADVVALTTNVLDGLGIDAVHVPPAR